MRSTHFFHKRVTCLLHNTTFSSAEISKAMFFSFHHLMLISSLATSIHHSNSYILHSAALSTIARNFSSSRFLTSSRLKPLVAKMSSSSTVEAEANSKPDIASNLQYVNAKITNCIQECNRPEGSVKLVAVSKTKPIELLMDAYNAGQRHFGENYAQELISKASTMPDDIQWHFIGPLQSNKAASLVKSVGIEKLACVETVSTVKLATKLNNAVESLLDDDKSSEMTKKEHKLGIYIQINTSGEESKSGIETETELKDLIGNITSDCPHLKINGLMTIGAPGDFTCFDKLVEFRSIAANVLGLESDDKLELSMGMSNDFEEAIKRGSTSVRVGSTIFGARDYSNKK